MSYISTEDLTHEFNIRDATGNIMAKKRALTAILLFLLALLFSLPNLVIAIVLMMLISAILEVLRMLADWQPKKQKVPVRRIS